VEVPLEPRDVGLAVPEHPEDGALGAEAVPARVVLAHDQRGEIPDPRRKVRDGLRHHRGPRPHDPRRRSDARHPRRHRAELPPHLGLELGGHGPCRQQGLLPFHLGGDGRGCHAVSFLVTCGEAGESIAFDFRREEVGLRGDHWVKCPNVVRQSCSVIADTKALRKFLCGAV